MGAGPGIPRLGYPRTIAHSITLRRWVVLADWPPALYVAALVVGFVLPFEAIPPIVSTPWFGLTDEKLVLLLLLAGGWPWAARRCPRRPSGACWCRRSHSSSSAWSPLDWRRRTTPTKPSALWRGCSRARFRHARRSATRPRAAPGQRPGMGHRPRRGTQRPAGHRRGAALVAARTCPGAVQDRADARGRRAARQRLVSVRHDRRDVLRDGRAAGHRSGSHRATPLDASAGHGHRPGVHGQRGAVADARRDVDAGGDLRGPCLVWAA